jgi:FMN-dependent NADH-azoreductase
MKILKIDSSVHQSTALSRKLGNEIVQRLSYQSGAKNALLNRDLANGVSLINEQWVNANFTEATTRSAEQRQILSESDTLIKELNDADVVIITVPLYNFSIPASLKAWIDQIFRARVTFKYAENGPVGLVADKPVYLVMTSGGVPIGSQMDFASGYLKQALGFIGLTDIRLVNAEFTNADAVKSESNAMDSISNWLPLGVINGDADNNNLKLRV